MTEERIIAMLSERLGAVVVPAPLLDDTDPAVIAWPSWNAALPAGDLSKIPTKREPSRRRRVA